MVVETIALARPDATLTMDTLRAQMEAAKRFVDSGLLPSAIKTPQQALTIMQMGRELGIPPTYALRNIHVINGKPVAAAELLMALVRRTYGQAAIRVKEASNDACTVEYREQGWDGVSSLTFTLEDAKRAKLDNKDVWRSYPRAMLRSRAVSEVVRTAFPECIANLYTPEELGADVEVTDDGTVQFVDVGAVVPQGEPGKIIDLPLICQGCEEEINGARFRDGTVLEPKDVAARSRERFGKTLCVACSKIEAAKPADEYPNLTAQMAAEAAE